MGGRRARARRRRQRSGGSSRAGAPTSSLLDLAALSAPYAVGDADIWELLLARGKAAHVDSVIVEGRVLMQGRVLQHLDREALMAEVAAAAAAAVARRTPEGAGVGRAHGPRDRARTTRRRSGIAR